jgi:uncharacterized protein YjcR
VNPPNKHQIETLLKKQSVGEIAELYEVSGSTIRGLCNRIGAHIPNKKERAELTRNAKHKKAPYVNPPPINNTIRRPSPPKEELEEYLKEKSTIRIASLYNVSVTTVKKWCVELGLEDLRQEHIKARSKNDRKKSHFPTVPLHRIGENKCQNQDSNDWYQSQANKKEYTHTHGKVKKVCEFCGEKFEYYPSTHPTRKTCSLECMDSLRKQNTSKVKKVCEFCGEKFEYYPSTHPTRKTCSSKCHIAMQLKPPPKEEFIAHLETKSIERITGLYGISTRTLNHWCKKLNLEDFRKECCKKRVIEIKKRKKSSEVFRPQGENKCQNQDSNDWFRNQAKQQTK